MTILGISAYYHDAAAAIVKDGKVLAAVQEERFSRIKHDATFPVHACRYCLEFAGLSIDALDAVVFYDKPFLKFERLIETYYRFAPKGLPSFLKAIPLWLHEKILLKQVLRKALKEVGAYDKTKLRLLFTEHHLSHAASAFFASPFKEAAILTIDGVGEWATATIGFGKDRNITVLKELHFPHSPGLLYSAFTYFLGFKVNGGEYKLMGLAPYGEKNAVEVERFKTIICEKLIDLKEDGSLWLNQSFFNYASGLKMIHEAKWAKLFGFPRRKPDALIEPYHYHLAQAIQQVIEEVVLQMAKETQRITGMQNLCMAGGVALNCVANGRLAGQAYFQNIFVQPAAGDAGGALGAALAAYHIYANQDRILLPDQDGMQGTYLGPAYSNTQIQQMIQDMQADFEYYENFSALCKLVSREIASGKVVGWFQGRMEYGPRALGNRSILGDPRHPEMQQRINLKIKYRESFRPFAPAVLAEDAGNYFKLDRMDTSYMLFVAALSEEYQIPAQTNASDSIIEKLQLPRSCFPAITHVDYSARVQTVSSQKNPRFYQLLQAFKQQTGHGILVNTSFNIKGEPIVCSPQDAYHCFQKTEMDILVIDNYIFRKT